MHHRGYDASKVHPIQLLKKLSRMWLVRQSLSRLPGYVADPLKLARCPHSLAPTLVTLPSMSLIPSAPLQAGHIANIFQE